MHADPMAAWGGYGPHVIWNCVRLLFTKATMWGREGRAWAPNPMPGLRYCPPLSFVSPRFRRGLILLEACASRTKLWLSSILLLSGGAGAFGKNDLAGVDIIIIPGSQGLPGGARGRGCAWVRVRAPVGPPRVRGGVGARSLQPGGLAPFHSYELHITGSHNS
mgnify:CR=1 FL=1